MLLRRYVFALRDGVQSKTWNHGFDMNPNSHEPLNTSRPALMKQSFP